MSACSDDGGTNEGGKATVKVALSDTSTSTATFTITSNVAGEYAVVVADEQYASLPDAAVVFMNGRVGNFSDGDNEIVVRGLKGNADNYVYLAVRTAAGMGDVELFTVRTDGFGGLVTVYEQDSCSDIRFHVEVPEGKTILCSVLLREEYWSYVTNLGYTTADLLVNWNGIPNMYVLTESTDVVYTGFADEDDGIGPMAADDQTMLALPGTAFVIMAGEGIPNGDGTYDLAFDYEGYRNNAGGGIAPWSVTKHEDMTPEEEARFWTGEHTTVFCNVTPPRESQHELEFTVDELTPLSATFTVKPCPEFQMVFYALIALDEDFKAVNEALGELGTNAFILDMAGFEHFEDTSVPMVIQSQQNLVYGQQYRLYLFGCEDMPPMTQKVVTYDFYPAERTQPAPVLEVSAASAPEGYEEHPNMVWFNLKSSTKNVTQVKYAVERPKEFVYYLNAGYYSNYNEFIEAVGNTGLTVRDIEKINSDEGLDIMFYSYADDLTRMVVVGYNEEGAASEASYADSRTIPYPAEAPVNSSLFSSLPGNWTLTYTDGAGNVRKLKTTITDGTPQYPASMTQEVYDVFAAVGVSKEKADEYYEEFKACAERFAASVKGRNRLLVEGLNMTMFQTNYMSAWDLFISSTYNTYSTDDCFVDFGPKWFLQIADGDKVSVPVADMWEYPVSCLDSNSNFMLGGYQYTSYDDYGFDFDITSFDVTVSDDGNTLTINPVSKDGKTYCMTIGQIFSGQLWASGVSTSALVLTRGWDEDTIANKSVGAPAKPVDCGTFENGVNRYRRTRIADIRPAKATVEVADIAARRAAVSAAAEANRR